MSSIGGLDPLADAYNLMGMQGMTGPNPYLQYTGQIPMAGYYGTPTDASGKPIQSFLDAQAAHDAWQPPAGAASSSAPGTTLNTPPPVHGVGGLQPGQWDAANGLPAGNPASFRLATDPSGMPNGMTSLGRGVVADNNGLPRPPAPQAPQAPQAAPPTNPIDMRQAYLNALSNPGKVTTPGAQMLPGTTPTGPVGSQPSVLQAFLSQHAGGGTAIPGGYSNQPFFNTLNQLQSQKGATS